jgi:hypothetical protein
MIHFLNNITFYEGALKHFSISLCPDCWLAGILSHQEGSRELGHKAVEKALGATFRIGPKDLFYDLMVRLAGILPHKEGSRKSGHKAIKKALGASAKSGPSEQIINRATWS